jgi:hypothetical protein
MSVLLNRGDDHSISGLQDQERIFGAAERRPMSLTFLHRRLIGFLVARWWVIGIARISRNAVIGAKLGTHRFQRAV